MSESKPEAVEFRDYLTIFAVSAAVMVYQITLTRVLSVVAWYHFAFLTISMVMLGLGVPGVWFAFVKRPFRYLPHFLLASGVFMPVSISVLVRIGALLVEDSVLYIVACILPVTLSLGGAVCLLLMKATGPLITRIYGADLLGAGLAALCVIPLMNLFPTPHLAAAMGLLPLGCLMLYESKAKRIAAAAAVGLAALIIHGESFQVRVSKSYDEGVVRPIHEKWSPTARITVFDESFFYLQEFKNGFTWGAGELAPSTEQITQYWLEQDGSAGTPITAYDGTPESVEHLLFDVTSVGYQVRPPERAAIIGAGGGRDILSALITGTKSIDAVELNQHTIDVVSNRFGDFSGHVYEAPGVTAYASEGRSHLTHAEGSYDLIQISLIDSWAASVAGAFALAENNLYTVEAFELYLSRLNPAGVLSTSRWIVEFPRLIVLAQAALEARGFEDPKAHMLIIEAAGAGTLLISPTPFSPEDLKRADEVCAQRGFRRIYPVDPGTEAPQPYIAKTMEDRMKSLEGTGINTEPPVDDSPYFFHTISPFAEPPEIDAQLQQVGGLQFNFASTGVLRQAMFAVSFLALGLFMLPFLSRLAPSQRKVSAGSMLLASVYFAAIGGGFMLLENVLLQRFVLYLGHPSYAVTVILAALLLGMGVGSMRAESIGTAGLRRLGVAVPLLLAALVWVLPPIFEASLGWALSLRVFVSAFILLPLGMVLGIFFPLGMVVYGDRSKPWLWAINGAFGVVASVMSLALSMDYGFGVVGYIAAGCYLLAWLCLRVSRDATEAEAEAEAEAE